MEICEKKNFSLKIVIYIYILLLIPLMLKGVFAKNEREYRLSAIKKALFIATNLTSICCVYKEKIVKDVSNWIT